MPTLHDIGLSAAIHIDGSPAVEYHDPIKNPDRTYPRAAFISKYIEAKNDSEYSIQCAVQRHNTWHAQTHGAKPPQDDDDHALIFNVHIDGNHQTSTCVKQSEWSASIVGVTGKAPGDAHQTMRKFRFNTLTKVETAPSAIIKNDFKRAPFLGTIRVMVWQGIYRGTSAAVPSMHRVADLSIAEKALKGTAVSHGTGLGAPVAIPDIVYSDVRYPGNAPVAIFQFKYRSKEALQAEMIMSRSPSPEPVAPPAGDAEVPSEDEKKQDGVETSTGKKKVIKREREFVAQIKREIDDIDDIDEIIDCTGDDDVPRTVKKRRTCKKEDDYDLFEDSDPFAD